MRKTNQYMEADNQFRKKTKTTVQDQNTAIKT